MGLNILLQLEIEAIREDTTTTLFESSSYSDTMSLAPPPTALSLSTAVYSLVAVRFSILAIRRRIRLKSRLRMWSRRIRKVVRLEVKELVKDDTKVGIDSVMAVLAYLYNCKIKEFPKGICVCVDDERFHISGRPAVQLLILFFSFYICRILSRFLNLLLLIRPAVDSLLQLLYLWHTFQIPELVALYQRQLLEIIDNIALDDLLIVVSVPDMCGNACEKLLRRCIDIIMRPYFDITTLKKSLPRAFVKQIIDLHKEFGLKGPFYVSGPNKHVKRIHRALESDDIELVTMLLRDGHTTLDDAFAHHFAVAHCDTTTTTELLELGLADVNLRDQREYTVLHVAAMRKDPKIIVCLLTKGAQATDVTLDGRNAVKIAKRLTKAADFLTTLEEGKAPHMDQLCIEILEQAERMDDQQINYNRGKNGGGEASSPEDGEPIEEELKDHLKKDLIHCKKKDTSFHNSSNAGNKSKDDDSFSGGVA